MEIILTVVITLMVVALTVSAINLVTLNKRTKELEDYNNMIDRNMFILLTTSSSFILSLLLVLASALSKEK